MEFVPIFSWHNVPCFFSYLSKARYKKSVDPEGFEPSSRQLYKSTHSQA